MIDFESDYFQKFSFSSEEEARFFGVALRDLKIAEQSDVLEVAFKFSYDALIKFGIVCIAKSGYKVRSVPGHHVKILEKLSVLLHDETIAILGNRMRQIRNFDFYGGGTEITEKESEEYLRFVKKAKEETEKFLERN